MIGELDCGRTYSIHDGPTMPWGLPESDEEVERSTNSLSTFNL
ncbi:hypothetical protein Pd630_LPD07908 [Rhodococcus opacus PD630]|nr:hypothetical protein Pd630_LPD07908 [Rhodococcus opacus PD630]